MALKLTTYFRLADLPPLPDTDTFHSAHLFAAYEATPGYRPFMVVASDNGLALAWMLGAVHSWRPHFSLLPFRRCEVIGPGAYTELPTAERDYLFAEMLGRLTDVALNYAQLVEVRQLPTALFGYKTFRQNGYFAVNWLRVRNSLHSVEQVEQRFTKTRIKQVQRGLRNGAHAHEASGPDEVRRFATMLHRVYSTKLRRFFPSKDFFTQMQAQLVPHGLCRIFTVTHAGRIIGGSVCTYSGSDAYLWFSGGMRKTYARQYPGILAVWIAMADAKARGYRHMEFMDVGLPFFRHSYREFVLQFGGNQVSTRRWFRLRSGWLNRIFIRLFM